MRPLSRWFVPLLLLVLAAGCGARTRAGSDATPVTYVRVTNQSWLDMNIYVIRSGERIRLGTVNGNRTERLTIPRHVVASAVSLRFMADPIGSSRTAQSFDISVYPGDEVTLTIPPSEP